MTGAVTVAGAAPAASSAPARDGAAGARGGSERPPYVLRDAAAPAVMSGTVHDVDMPIVDKEITVAKGFVVHAWTFGGTVPGPTIRVHLGDTVRVHLTNQGAMSHSIDFHASQTAMNDQMVEIKPARRFTYTFTADYAGVWMYHCGTAPALHHIANGMFGMVIVEPKGGLPKVDQEVALGPERVVPRRPEASRSTTPRPMPPRPPPTSSSSTASPTSTRTTRSGHDQGAGPRAFVLNVGPNVDSSFHIVGTIFDTVIKEGIVLAKGNAGGWGSQAVDLAPAQGAIIEFSPHEDGMYPMVTHAFNFVGRGAIGIFMAGDGDPKN